MKTTTKLLLSVLVIAVSLSSCQDEDMDGQNNNNNNNNNNSSDYYFRLTYSGTEYFYDNDLLQIGDISPSGFGGWVPDNTLSNAAGIQFDFPDTVTSAEILGLAGRTISFSSTSNPEVEIKNQLATGHQYSEVNSLSNYSVSITEVTFLRNENALWDIDIYAVKGTFTARMETVSGTYIDDASGSFFLQCAKGNY